jgi:peptidoglycan/xylan/chitin deacetylase (PgdA/CDA1 family)
MPVATMARGGIQRSVKAVAALAPAGAGSTVLIYHRVGPGSSEMTVPVEVFAAQMAEVAAHGVGILDDFVGGAAPRSVVTFDDGTADIVDNALPVLVEHRVPMTLYLATDFVERHVDFPAYGTPITWAGLRECLSTGLVTIGSHTHTHTLLDRVDAVVAAEELDTSIKLIEDRLGLTPAHFAYPKAVLGSAEARREVAARFVTAAVAGTRPNRPGATDLQRLHRTPIQRSDGMRFFRRKLAGGMRFEDDLRRLANRVRYRGASA